MATPSLGGKFFWIDTVKFPSFDILILIIIQNGMLTGIPGPWCCDNEVRLRLRDAQAHDLIVQFYIRLLWISTTYSFKLIQCPRKSFKAHVLTYTRVKFTVPWLVLVRLSLKLQRSKRLRSQRSLREELTSDCCTLEDSSTLLWLTVRERWTHPQLLSKLFAV